MNKHDKSDFSSLLPDEDVRRLEDILKDISALFKNIVQSTGHERNFLSSIKSAKTIQFGGGKIEN